MFFSGCGWMSEDVFLGVARCQMMFFWVWQDVRGCFSGRGRMSNDVSSGCGRVSEDVFLGVAEDVFLGVAGVLFPDWRPVWCHTAPGHAQRWRHAGLQPGHLLPTEEASDRRPPGPRCVLLQVRSRVLSTLLRTEACGAVQQEGYLQLL